MSTMPSSATPSSARAANEAAEFLPADPDDLSTLPCLRVAGALVFAYITDDGLPRVSLHLDTGDIADWLIQPDGTVPVEVTVNGETVAALPTSPARGQDPDAVFDGVAATAVTAGALAADLSYHDPRSAVWVQDALLPTRFVPLRPGVTPGSGPTTPVGARRPVVVLGVVEDRR